MKKINYIVLSSLLLTQVSSAHAHALSDFFNSIISGKNPGSIASNTGSAPKVSIAAQINPSVSPALNNTDNSCTPALSTADFFQFQQDQLLVNSIIKLYSLNNIVDKAQRTAAQNNANNLNNYMAVLTNKLSAVASQKVDPVSASIMKDLGQKDLMLVNYANNNTTIAVIDSYVRAHQSLELEQYNIDDFIVKAKAEYSACLAKESSCPYNDATIWKKWFDKEGAGLTNPLLFTNYKDSKGTNLAPSLSTIKTNFSLNAQDSETHSAALSLKLFEFINMYGGKNFDQFAFLESGVLKDSDLSTDGTINSPGKVTVGILLKLANQRLVAFYKYQRCRSLTQNATNLRSVASLRNTNPLVNFFQAAASLFSRQKCMFSFLPSCRDNNQSMNSNSAYATYNNSNANRSVSSYNEKKIDPVREAADEAHREVSRKQKQLEDLHKQLTQYSLTTLEKNKLVDRIEKTQLAIDKLKVEAQGSVYENNAGYVQKNEAAIANGSAFNSLGMTSTELEKNIAANKAKIDAIRKDTTLSADARNQKISVLAATNLEYHRAQTQISVASANNNQTCGSTSLASDRKAAEASVKAAEAKLAAAKNEYSITSRKLTAQEKVDKSREIASLNTETSVAKIALSQIPLVVEGSCK